MKNISLGLNVILTIAVIILYYFQFSNNNTADQEALEKDQTEEVETPLVENPEAKETNTPSSIGYINLDSLQLNYALYNELAKKSKAKEKRYTAEYNAKRTDFEAKFQKFQQDAPTMTQFEGQMKEKELTEERDKLLLLDEQLSQKLQNEVIKMNNQIAVKIKDFVSEYNEQIGYDIIIGSTQAGNIVLYNKDGINLTTPITEGLNEQYNSEKKK